MSKAKESAFQVTTAPQIFSILVHDLYISYLGWIFIIIIIITTQLINLFENHHMISSKDELSKTVKLILHLFKS